MSSEYCVLFEGHWIKPEWISVKETKAPDFNEKGYVPAKVHGLIRLFPASHVAPIAGGESDE